MDEARSIEPNRREVITLVVILAAGLLLRFAYMASIWHAPDFASPVLDPQLNDYWARAMVTGDWTPPPHADDPEIRTTPYGRPPGYPFFLAAVYRVFGLDYGAPRIAQAVLGMVNLLLLWLLGRAWFGRNAGLAAAALGAVCWPLIYFEGELNSPVLEVFSYLAMAGALWQWLRSGHWGWSLLAGALLGLHALVRPNVLFPGVLVALWMALTARHGGASLKRGAMQTAAFLLAAAVVISPALARNWRVSREFVLISYYGGINAYIGNNPSSTGDSPKMADLKDISGRREWNCFNYPQLVRSLAEKQGLPGVSFSAASDWFYKRALQFWERHPLAALRLTARKAALFWGPAEVSDSKVVAVEREHSPLLRLLPGFPMMLALALLGLVLLLAGRNSPTPENYAGKGYVKSPFEGGNLATGGVGDVVLSRSKTSRAVSLALTLIIGHFLSVLPFFIAGRYRMPVTPFLILLGGAGLSCVAGWAFTPGLRRRAAVGAVGCVVLYALTSIPLVSYRPSLSAWHYHRGIALADSGRPVPAADEFRAAVQADPKNASAWLRLGFASAAAGDSATALNAYTHAAEADPDNALAHNNLGWELKKVGRTDRAREEFEAALKVDPGLEIAAINLANLFLEVGERNRAVAIYEELLKNNPKAQQATKNLEVLKAKTSQS